MTFNLQENYNCWGFLLWEVLYQWNRECTLSTFPLSLQVFWYLLKKWCLITELCIPFSCKMALRWAPCCWGCKPCHCNVLLARTCADRILPKVHHNGFKGVAVILVLHGTPRMIALSPAVKMPSQMEELQLCQESNSFSGTFSCCSILSSTDIVQQRVLSSDLVLAPYHCLLGILMYHHVKLPFQAKASPCWAGKFFY